MWFTVGNQIFTVKCISIS